MTPHAQIEHCLGTYWLKGEFFWLVGWKIRDAEAAHLPKFSSAIVAAEIVPVSGPRFFIAHLCQSSPRDSWEPGYESCGDGVGSLASSFINHQFMDHVPREEDIDEFLKRTKWSLPEGYRVVVDTAYSTISIL